MPKPQKRGHASGPRSSAPAANAVTSLPTTLNQFHPVFPSPPPFTLAPETLKPFLTPLAKNHIYITNLDTHPRDFKRRLFAVPLLLNIFLSTLLLYRATYALPTYISLFLTAVGLDTEHRVSVDISEMSELMMVVGERMTMMIVDFFLFRFIGGWPWAFFLGWLGGNRGLGSPVSWRRGVGFRDTEIVVRRSRKWDVDIYGSEAQKSGGDPREGGGAGKASAGNKANEWVEKGKQGLLWRERIEPAVSERWIREKTGYLMMDKSWDLDFDSMITAHHLLEDGAVETDEFRTRVLVYVEKYGGWLTWDVWRQHGIENTENKDGRRIRVVREKLKGMGKEELFYRWIEVLQSETSTQPGPFTDARRKQAVEKVRDEFRDYGVDFTDFWDDLGGVEAMPGLEIQGT